jgi:hypothetical protein
MNGRKEIKQQCEGVGCRPCFTSTGSVGICAMCGTNQPLDTNGNVTGHERVDVLAQIERGDYG